MPNPTGVRKDNPWTPDRAANLLRWWNDEGLTHAEISDKFYGRFSPSAVRNHLRYLAETGHVIRNGGRVLTEPQSRRWPKELTEPIMDLRLKHGKSYGEISKWLAAQGITCSTNAVKNGVRYLLIKQTGKKPSVVSKPARDLRLPYEPGHPITWGALNQLLPNVGPLHYIPGL